MNKNSIKYVVTSLVVISCSSIFPKITIANANPSSINSLESSASCFDRDNNIQASGKHKGFKLFSEDNLKYLSSDQKKELEEIKKCKDNGDTLSKEQEETLQSIIDCIIKGKLGDKNYEEFKILTQKKKSNEKLTDEETTKLKEYRSIIHGCKLSTKEILNQFLR
jgi:hypothetical protein